MVDRTPPRIPPSSRSLAKKLATPASLAHRWDELVNSISALQEEAERLETETVGGYNEASHALIEAGIVAEHMACKVVPNTTADAAIIVKMATAAAEFTADNQDDPAISDAARCVTDALAGLSAFLKGATA